MNMKKAKKMNSKKDFALKYEDAYFHTDEDLSLPKNNYKMTKIQNICTCGHEESKHDDSVGEFTEYVCEVINCPCKKFQPIMDLEALKIFNKAVKGNFNIEPRKEKK